MTGQMTQRITQRRLTSVLATLITVSLYSLLLPRIYGQEPEMPGAGGSHSIHVDAVVETKNGQPVTKLGQSNFTVLDNKTARPITSFKVGSGQNTPVNVILLVDAVNTP
jgi:hypothetical protein